MKEVRNKKKAAVAFLSFGSVFLVPFGPLFTFPFPFHLLLFFLLWLGILNGDGLLGDRALGLKTRGRLMICVCLKASLGGKRTNPCGSSDDDDKESSREGDQGEGNPGVCLHSHERVTQQVVIEDLQLQQHLPENRRPLVTLSMK